MNDWDFLSVAEQTIVRLIGRRIRVTARELARELAIPAAQAGRHAGDLQRLGLVEVAGQDGQDTYTLTPAGKAALQRDGRLL